MALIKCKECGHEVSDKASSCPNCGCPIQQENYTKNVEDTKPKSARKRNVKVYVLAIVILCLLGGGGFYFYTLKSEGKGVAELVNKLSKDEDIVELTPEFIEAVRKYDEVGDFSEGLAAVCKDEKWGFINTKGEEIIPCKYEQTLRFSEEFVAVRKDDKWGFINAKGKEVISCQYEVPDFYDLNLFDAYMFSEGLAAVCKDEKWGFINAKGEEIIPYKYDHAESFSEGFAAVQKGDKWGFVNTKGVEVVPCKYDINYHNKFSEGLAVVKKDGKYGFVNIKGEEIIPCKYDDAQPFSGGLAAIEKDDKWSYINVKGEDIVSCESDVWYCSPLSEGFAVVSNGKCGFADIKGMVVVQCKYNYAESFSEGLAAVEKDSKYGFINTKGEEVIQCKYEFVHSFSENGVALAGFNVGNKWIYGYVDKEGNDTFSKEDWNMLSKYEQEQEEERRAAEEEQREEEERIRREGVEKIVSLTIELRNNSHIISFHGSYGAINYFNDYVHSKRINIPDGKVWIYKKEDLKKGSILEGFLLYYSRGNNSKGFDYDKDYKFSDGNVPVLRSGDGFRIGIYCPRGSLSENDSNNTVMYNVYFVEKDEEDYY